MRTDLSAQRASLGVLALFLLLSASVQSSPINPSLGHTAAVVLTPRNASPRLVVHSAASTGFVEQLGQFVDTDGRVRDELRYVADIGAVRIAARPSGISYVFTAVDAGARGISEADGQAIGTSPSGRPSATAVRTRAWRVDIDFEGADPSSELVATEETGETRHYYSPHHPAGIHGARVFKRLTWRGVYPGIDLVYAVTDSGLKYDVVVRPGADPARVRLRYSGSSALSLDADGRLHAGTPLGSAREDAPVSWIEHDGRRTPVPSAFRLDGSTLTFDAPAPRTGTLVIDPCVHWTTYFGGSTSDFGRDVAVDRDNAIITAGYTSSRDFPVSPGVMQDTHAGQIDVVIARTAPDGRRLWCTFFGGSGADEWPSVAVASNGDIAVAGFTSSPNLPVSAGAMQTTYAGNTDGFVLKLDRSGRRLWATYLGGSYSDEAADVAFDEKGAVFVTGATYSTNFPVSSGAFQTSNAGDFDAFLLKLGSGGQRQWCTYVGGWSMEYGTGVAVDDDGSAVIVGYTEGNTFPVSERAAQSVYGGGAYDGFVARFNASGARQWCTYVGGSDEDRGARVVIDTAGTITVCGSTKSRNLPLHAGAFQKDHAGVRDGFVARFSARGEPGWTTYIGGTADDQALAIAATPDGGVVLTGFTESPNFPVSSDAVQLTLAGAADAFILRIDAQGMRTYGSYLGGRESDLGYGIATDAAGNVVLTGVTSSTDLPLTGSPTQRALAGIDDAFLQRVIFAVPVADAGENTVICVGGSVRLGSDNSSGFGSTTYSWTPGEGLDDPAHPRPVASPRQSTFYVLTVRDEAGCEAVDTVAVTVIPPPVVDAGPDATLCPGGAVTLGTEPQGASLEYSYHWSPSDGLSDSESPRPEARPSRTTRYTLTITTKQKCTAVDSVLVTVRPAPIVALGPDRTVCAGVPTPLSGEAAGGEAPYRYAWTPATGLSSATDPNPVVTITDATEYILTVTDARGCSSSDTIRLSVHPQLTADAGEDAASCFGKPVRLTGRVSGGRRPYTLQWNALGGSSAASTAAVQVQPRVTTPYIFTVTDANGCVATDTVLVRVQERIAISAGEDADICQGASVIRGGEASGGIAPYTYQWKPDAGVSDPRIATPQLAPNVTRTYVVTVTDAAGCTGSDTVTIVVHEPPKVAAGKDQNVCAGTSVRLGEEARGGTPPYTYHWTPPEGVRTPASAVTDILPRSTATYTLTVTDAHGCSASSSVTLTVEAPPLVSAGRDTSVCIGDAIRLSAVAAGGREPYRYEWSPAEGLSRGGTATPEVSPQRRTTYVVRVTDARGCTAVDSVTVDVYSKPKGDAGRDTTICPGGTANLRASIDGGRPPYRIQWSPETGVADPAAAETRLSAAKSGVWTLTVTDANGCSTSDAVAITVAPPLTVALAPPPRVCVGAVAALSAKAGGGVPPYRFEWTAGDRNERGPQPRFSFTAERSVPVTVRVFDAAGCSTVDSVWMDVPAPLTVAVAAPDPLCPGTTTVLRAEVAGGIPPYTYLWSSGSNRPATAGTARARASTVRAALTRDELTIDPQASTEYTLRVTDAMGCRSDARVSVRVHPRRSAAIAVLGDLSFCEGDSVLLSSGDGFAAHRWSDGADGMRRVVRDGGTWRLTAVDEFGCTSESAPVTVKKKDSPRPAISVKGSTELCAGSSLTLDAGAGYTAYRWSNGARTRMITVAEAGSYSVEVTAKNGCSARSSAVDVRVLPLPDARLARSGDTLRVEATGTVQRIRWMSGARVIDGATGPELRVTRRGSYRAVVTGLGGCSVTTDAVTVDPEPRVVPPRKSPPERSIRRTRPATRQGR